MQQIYSHRSLRTSSNLIAMWSEDTKSDTGGKQELSMAKKKKSGYEKQIISSESHGTWHGVGGAVHVEMETVMGGGLAGEWCAG